ncbi:MAG TPA: fructose-6-phosphate aldolase [Smithellaceae bacterium]|jgi:transaldolase|nr:fructose-6-phosphate aldolase [Smithellaceae bacterium]OPZ52942.1 MAG: Transaldolase [Deltaproteobacteria bacterium ADurb.BinA014]HNV64840.1 fructose-6-phosphate aldolase [Smithellaceae bacterium]HOD31382.1 fructose-6-phosphate aldolase [Smithellaceae bacterium]HOM69424.1 fructose-6-phosphate aldolase [Smithellaceae bacterium]
MKFFIDTANIEEIKEGLKLGMVDGVTTNPSLIAKEKKSFEVVVKEILKNVEGPVSLEVVSMEAKPMFEEGKKLAQWGDNVVIKVPLCTEGLKATKMFAAAGIDVNETLIFSPLQALMAAKAGARYVSPFVGRLDDIAHDGMDLVEQILTIFDNYGFDTEVIVASIRHPRHVLEAALMGADIATIPFKVIKQLTQHPLTDKGIEMFLEDWKKVPLK